MSPRPADYDKHPTIALPDGSRVWAREAAWTELAAAVRRAQAERDRAGAPPIIAVDCYPGVDVPELVADLTTALPDCRVVDIEAAAKPTVELDAMIARNLTDDRVFGLMSHFTVDEFYDFGALTRVGRQATSSGCPVLLVGWGATIVPVPIDVIVLADLPRWEIQQRYRAGATNWHANNPDEDTLRKYKRGFFVEWRTADRHKRSIFDRIDFLLDTTRGIEAATMITGAAFRGALAAAVTRPFRVVPFFDPGVWGGTWMQERIGLPPTKDKYAWCFDCVPEENSLLLAGDGGQVEIPALDLVLTQPRGLLGEKTFARFGAEFPIRFDFLDTMGGGNLSLQVHPLTDYILDTFGMHYTQDESYYLLDAGEDATVYLGLKEGIDPERMLAGLRAAADPAKPFDADEFVNRFPAKKHDHFLIPAGTVHASGSNSMVLEISATPFIFTFKLWDWGRVGLDGIPRPTHVEHGAKNIQWDRTTNWVEKNLVGQVEVISDADGVREERTGLHELEFIEVRRHWFDTEAAHDTDGTVNVLNLVEGDVAEVVSPTGAFDPFRVHYAETFIVPAAVGPYLVRRTADSTASQFATVTASVRGTANHDN